MLLSLLCICARLIGPKKVIFILLAVSVDDMAKTFGCERAARCYESRKGQRLNL